MYMTLFDVCHLFLSFFSNYPVDKTFSLLACTTCTLTKAGTKAQTFARFEGPLTFKN